MPETSDQQVVLDFVQGRRSWRDLEFVGVTVSFMDDGCDCDGQGTIVVAPSAPDIALGLLQKMREPAPALQRWASVVLAASAVIDLKHLGEVPDGELLLEAVWEASAGQPIDDASVKFAESLVHGR